MNFRAALNAGISWQAEELLAAQEGLWYMDLFN
jgi:hypothetical protein